MMIRRMFCIVALVCFVGCGGGGAESDTTAVFPVSGNVLVDGEPVEYVSIAFVPQSGAKGGGGFGITDKDGNFTMKYNDGRDGIPTGNYYVLFTRTVQADGTPIPEDAMAADLEIVNTLPRHYGEEGPAALTAKVTENSEPLKFELKAK